MWRGLVTILLAIAIVSMFSFLSRGDEQGASASTGRTGSVNETSAGSDVAQGGNVTQMNLSVVISTDKWQGYYGNATGVLALGLGNSIFYNFSSAVSSVYATQNASLNFLVLEAAAAADIDTVWGYSTASDSDQAIDIYTGTTSVEGVSAPSVELNPIGLGWNSTIFDTGSNTYKGYFAFGVNVQGGGNNCFDGSTCQYELLVPASGLETYYFYLSIS